jgi:hypothetical protein
MAAALACADGAAISHQSAAALLGLLSVGESAIHVSVPGTGGRGSRRGIRIHRRLSLSPGDVTRHRGIPVTTPARTLSDLKRVVSPSHHRHAARQAAAIGYALGEGVPLDRTRSELEFLFLRLCRRWGIPGPEVNVRVGPVTVDFLWRTRRLVVETDGYRYHRGSTAFEEDRSRDLMLRGLGYEVIRLSWRQVGEESAQVAAVLRAALSP